MKIYSINQTFNIENSNIIKTKSLKTNNYPYQINTNISSYPKNYYLNQIAFGFKSTLSAIDLIAKIGEENFPSEKIVEKLKRLGFSKDFSLYDIHMEHYKDLLNCSTLEEAKQKYPEFKDVIDAKDIDYKSEHKKSVLYRVGNKQIPGIDIKDLSLELLKKQYGQLISTAKKDKYYNCKDTTTFDLFERLKIKKMNTGYLLFATKSNFKNKELISKKAKKRWAEDDGRLRKISAETAKKLWEKDDGTLRRKKSEAMLRFWELDDGTLRENLSNAVKKQWKRDDGSLRDKVSINSHTPKATQKRANTINSPKYKEKMKKYKQALKLAWARHPEITNIMSEVAKLYPGLTRILEKIKRGIKLTETEEAARNAYFKECERRMPGYKNIIGQEYHNILIDWGLKEE